MRREGCRGGRRGPDLTVGGRCDVLKATKPKIVYQAGSGNLVPREQALRWLNMRSMGVFVCDGQGRCVYLEVDRGVYRIKGRRCPVGTTAEQALARAERLLPKQLVPEGHHIGSLYLGRGGGMRFVKAK